MIVFSKEAVNLLFEEAKNQYPDECCGFCMGVRNKRRRIVKNIFPVQNGETQEAQKEHFLISTDMLLYAEFVAAKEDYEIIGIYHSHPNCKAIPSKEDSEFAIPGISYPIVSVKANKIKDFRSWEIVREQGSEQFVSEEIEMELM